MNKRIKKKRRKLCGLPYKQNKTLLRDIDKLCRKDVISMGSVSKVAIPQIIAMTPKIYAWYKPFPFIIEENSNE